MSRRFLVPEYVQTFAMDCGPAALSALLAGHGLPVSFDALRARCQTGIDGTSIDDLERVAGELGLEVEQIMVPADYALDPATGSLPALATTTDASGALHFVVLWSRWGDRVQVMDPRRGRYWARAAEVRDTLLQHVVTVDGAAFDAFAAAPRFRAYLARRAARYGSRAAGASAGDLDGALRLVETLDRTLPRGQLATVARAFAAAPERIPRELRFATPTDGGVELRGAVLLRVVRAAGAPGASAVRAPRPPRSRGWPMTPIIAAATAGAAVLSLVEGLVLRGGLDLVTRLGGATDRAAAVGAGLGLLALNVGVSALVGGLTDQLGRKLELDLRTAFLAKIPRISRAWLTSRPASDWADRGHAVHAVRELPRIARQIADAVARMALLVVGIGWLSPWLFVPAVVVAGLSLALPLVVQRTHAPRELRAATQSGALSRFTLDAMLGLVPIRTHGAERTVRAEHEALLADWARSVHASHAALAVGAGAQVWIGLGLGASLLGLHALVAGVESGATLLLVYWALLLPTYGELLAGALNQLPYPLAVLARLRAPLDAPEEDLPLPGPPTAGPVALALDGVTVELGGRPVLREVSVRFDAGEHVAVVGASGSGKSTLLSTILGLAPVAGGAVTADGSPLAGEALARLRRQLAWVDPTVQLFNRSLLANLRYGIDDGAGTAPGECLESSDLGGVVQGLPDGMRTALGEGGSRLSGGEGNRVRLARALGRPDVRLALLDEAFRGLDRWTRTTLLARTRAHFGGATLVCVTHDVSDTTTFPRVVVMAEGRVVEDGPPDVLAAAGGAYAQLLAKEGSVATGWWAHPGWRRWWVEGGGVRVEER